MSKEDTRHQAGSYLIVFQGHLDERRARWFEGMTMIQHPGGETALSGPAIDQAALHGTLSRIRDLGLTLLLVRRMDYSEFKTNQDNVRKEK